MKYLAILKGSAEGCDYTLGCNTDVIEIEADSVEGAWDVVKNVYDWNDEGADLDYYIEEMGLSEVFIVPDNRTVFSLIDMQKERDERDRLRREGASAKEEYEMYERLKKKFEEH